MVKFFESLGMAFGQHQNAFTSFDQTTYMMMLPDNKQATVEKVLLYFSDVAHGLLLRDEEIDRERGVILEEARARKGAQMRIMEQALPAAFPGSRIKDRLPIGTEDVIRSAPRAQFVDFYRRWYRPGNATLIVCGDIEKDTVLPWAAKAFAAWKPVPNPTAPRGAGIQPEPEGLRTMIVSDPEMLEASVSLTSHGPIRKVETLGDLRDSIVERVAIGIVNRRLREIRQKGQAQFMDASVSSDEQFHVVRATDITASG